MTMNPLREVQTRLDERGVQDVKFLFSRDAYAKLPSDVSVDVADVLSKYFDGKYVDLGDFVGEVLSVTFA